MLLFLSVFSSTTHTADNGGIDHEEGINCSHGAPTRGAPCSACLHEAAQTIALSPVPSAPAPGGTQTSRGTPRTCAIEELRIRRNLGRPSGGHQDLGRSYA